MIQYLSLFSGIGAFEKALERQGVPFELVNYCEIDKYASKSYAAIHGVSEDLNLWDITNVDEKKLPKNIDLITYGFPCQDISLAGKQRGFFHEDGTQTRSGLFFEALRIIEETQPKIAIAENVKNLTSKKFKEQFGIVLSSLEEAGYNNYWQVLNAKNYGIPQNRERVFIVSIRKDIDTGLFEFPKGFALEKRLKDVLEDEVDEKYYLQDSACKRLIENSGLADSDFNENTPAQLAKNGTANKFSSMQNASLKNVGSDFALTITSRYWKGIGGVGDNMVVEPNSVLKIGNTSPSGKSQCNDVYSVEGVHPTLCAGTHGNCNSSILVHEPTDVIRQVANVSSTATRKNPNQGRVYDSDYIAPTLSCMGGGNREPHIIVKEATSKGYAEAYEGDSINLKQLNSKTRRGRVGKQVAQTLTTSPQQAVVEPHIQRIDIPQNVTVRKYEVDTDRLKKLLKEHKNMSNKEIASTLDKPITLVEHWFRNDNCFSIPDADIWIRLKELLNITTDEFDLPITEFAQRDGVYEKANRCYMVDGISPTLTSTSADEKIIEPRLRIRKLTPLECFRLMGFDDEDFYKAEKVNSNTQLYKQAGNSIVVDVAEELFCMMLDENGNIFV